MDDHAKIVYKGKKVRLLFVNFSLIFPDFCVMLLKSSINSGFAGHDRTGVHLQAFARTRHFGKTGCFMPTSRRMLGAFAGFRRET